MAIYKEKSLQKEARNLRFYSFRPLFPSLKKKKKKIYHVPWFHDPEEEDQPEEKRAAREQGSSIYQSFPPRPRNEISTRASSRGKTVSATTIKRGENEKKYSISGALYTRDMEDHERWSRDDELSIARFHESTDLLRFFV